jgi:hypothetical protein
MIIHLLTLFSDTTWLPRVVLDTQPTDSNSIFVKHKTTYREIYNQARQRQGNRQ